MEYVVLLVGYSDDRDWSTMDEAEQGEWMAMHDAFDVAVAEREGCELRTGRPLNDDPAVFVRRGDGPGTFTDGPYAESTEQIGGFYVIEAPDRQVLGELLGVLPPYVMEVRSVDTSIG